jgi:hypothetical protein
MSLPQLYQPPPGDRGWQEYWFWHFQDHLEIVQRLQLVLNVQLTVYDIDPWVDASRDQILEQHQQFHNDFNGLLNTPGNDLSDVDFKNQGQLRAWIFLNYQEHQNAHQALEI